MKILESTWVEGNLSVSMRVAIVGLVRMVLLILLPLTPLSAKSLVVITPHGDDYVIYAGGTIAKLIDEGYTATLIRVTNDEKHSRGFSTEETRLRATEETEAAAKILGFQEVIHLNFKDGELDPVSETEIRGRFIQLFRLLKPEALMTCDPWTRYDDNFDHQKVGRAVEDASWTGGNEKFHPEINRAGLMAYGVRHRYYWSAGQRFVNQVFDISSTRDRKKQALKVLPTLTRFRPYRLKGQDAATEEFHYTQGSGLQGPYVEWYEQQLKNDKSWAAPSGQVKVVSLGPVKDRTLLIISPHADDFSIFAGGTIAQMIKAGFTAYLIRVTNDEKDSYDLSPAETIRHNAEEVEQAARLMGIKEVISLNFKNDELDPVSHTEMRGRFILLFRLLRPDAIMTFDPWSLYEENPDHLKVARAAAEAAWAAGLEHYNREHFTLGLRPYAVPERYYWARGPSDINQVFDISSTIDLKLRTVKAHQTMMKATALHLKDKLKLAGLRLPLLDKEEKSSYNQLVDIWLREAAENVGKAFGLKYAERFHYERTEE